MGEKGNVLEPAAVPGAASVMERITTTTTETVVDAGQDLAGTIRDKAIEAVADNTVAAAREKLTGDDATDSSDAPPPT